PRRAIWACSSGERVSTVCRASTRRSSRATNWRGTSARRKRADRRSRGRLLRPRRQRRLQAKVHRPVEAFGALHVAERLELAPEAPPGGAGEGALEGRGRLGGGEEGGGQPSPPVAVLRAAGPRPQGARPPDPHAQGLLLLAA